MLERFAHDTYPVDIYVKDGAGEPYPLVGASVEMRVLDQSGATLHTLPSTVVDATRGHAIVDFSSVSLAPGAYRYVVSLTDSAGYQRTVAVGDLLIQEDYVS